MWMPALLEVARAEHFTLVPLTKSGCNPDEWVKPIEGYPAPTTPAPSVCRAWYAWVVHEVRVLHPAVVLATGAYGAALGPRQKAIVGAFSALTTSIHRSAGRLVVIGDAPARTQQPVDCLLASGATMKTCTSTWTWQRSAIDAVAATIERRGAGFIDVTRWFCYQTLCPMVIGHTIAYVDTGHLTKTYARDLGGVFGAALRRVLARRR
jgi:hypothetical protein